MAQMSDELRCCLCIRSNINNSFDQHNQQTGMPSGWCGNACKGHELTQQDAAFLSHVAYNVKPNAGALTIFLQIEMAIR
jgi:hypothetical protein